MVDENPRYKIRFDPTAYKKEKDLQEVLKPLGLDILLYNGSLHFATVIIPEDQMEAVKDLEGITVHSDSQYQLES